MAKVKEEKFVPKPDEVDAMSLCWKNDLAYVITPSRISNRFNVIKYQISNYKEWFFYKENDEIIHFTEYEGLKKTMELYKFHAKRFTK
jgi:hypothetical protein